VKDGTREVLHAPRQQLHLSASAHSKNTEAATKSLVLKRFNFLKMDGSEDFESLRESISYALVNTTRVAGQVYSEDITFHRSLNPAVAAALDRQNARLLDLAGSLLRAATSGSNIEAPYLKDVDDIDNSWRGVVEVVDSLLERADTSLDEYTGVIKKLTSAEEAV
jgi:exosome complex exonuclease RRP6